MGNSMLMKKCYAFYQLATKIRNLGAVGNSVTVTDSLLRRRPPRTAACRKLQRDADLGRVGIEAECQSGAGCGER